MSEALYDLLLAGGRVIDPASARDGVYDLAVKNGRIVAIAGALDRARAGRVVDVTGCLVLPGLIDIHTHVFEHVTGRFGLNPDLVGVRSGVTTVTDLGGAASLTFAAFRHFVAERAKTRVYSFISPYVIGALESHGYPELYGPHGVDPKALAATIERNRDLVRGLKMHAEIGGVSRWGFDVIRHAIDSARQAGIPAYVHLGQMWPGRQGAADLPDPDETLTEALSLLQPGDILAHPFSRSPGSFIDQTGRVSSAVIGAIKRGLRVDVGRGGHISYERARRVLDAGIVPFTCGSDLHGYNTRLTPRKRREEGLHPAFQALMGERRFGLHTVMSELLALGLSLEQVIPMVTTHPAEVLGLRREIGELGVGRVADVSVLSDERGRWVLVDQTASRLVAERMLHPRFCLRAGELIQADSPILAALEEYRAEVA